MKLFTRYLMVFLFSFQINSLAIAKDEIKPEVKTKIKAGSIIPGVVIVKFKKSVSVKDIVKLNARLGTTFEIISSELNLYKVKLPEKIAVEKAIKLFQNQINMVEYAEPDRVMTIQNKKIKIMSNIIYAVKIG